MVDPSAPPPPPLPRPASAAVRDLRGGVRLAMDGVHATIGRLEDVHHRLAEVSPPVRGLQPGGPERGWPAMLYRGLRGTTDLVGGALDLALATLQAGLQSPPRTAGPQAPAPTRESVVAVLNALVGDHLHRTDNPLAIATQLHQRDAPARPRVLVLVHDLGLNDLQWRQGGQDHGAALAAALDCTPLYAAYNSGRHAWSTGRELAAELEQRLAHWRVPVESLVLLGHGLGGLVLRSALHQAVRSGQGWPAHLRKLVFLGTPLGGAPGTGPDRLFGLVGGPQSALAPLARLARRRSDGMDDFVAGRFLEQDLPNDAPTLTSLPPGAHAYAVAGRLGDGDGDGLVPEASALGRDPLAGRGLALADDRRWVAQGVDHVGLLRSDAVLQALRRWLAP
jgi:hypothetical protein